MALVNLVVNLCVEHMRDQLRTHSKEVITAVAAAPALANAALIIAKGCPNSKSYRDNLQLLYAANHLPAPDLGLLNHLDNLDKDDHKTNVTSVQTNHLNSLQDDEEFEEYQEITSFFKALNVDNEPIYDEVLMTDITTLICPDCPACVPDIRCSTCQVIGVNDR